MIPSGQAITFTPQQAEIFTILWNRRTVLTPWQEIADLAWTSGTRLSFTPMSDVIRAHICRMNKLLKDTSVHITSERNCGYLIVERTN